MVRFVLSLVQINPTQQQYEKELLQACVLLIAYSSFLVLCAETVYHRFHGSQSTLTSQVGLELEKEDDFHTCSQIDANKYGYSIYCLISLVKIQCPYRNTPTIPLECILLWDGYKSMATQIATTCLNQKLACILLCLHP